MLLDLAEQYERARRGAPFSPAVDHPGGCYTCRYFGQRVVETSVWCINPSHEHVRSQAERGCAFWEREPGADA